MPDVVSKKVRSRMMAGIGSKHTKPEVALRKLLHRAGFRFRLHRSDLPGRPDLVMAKHATAIFVHGCFWHRHTGCRFCYVPASNQEFWRAKFSANMDRDSASEQALMRNGWRVVVVWECATREERTNPGRLLDRFSRWLRSGRRRGYIGARVRKHSARPSTTKRNKNRPDH